MPAPGRARSDTVISGLTRTDREPCARTPACAVPPGLPSAELPLPTGEPAVRSLTHHAFPRPARAAPARGRRVQRSGVPTTSAGQGPDGTVSWTVIVPVKRLASAKSRLRGALPAAAHAALVMAWPWTRSAQRWPPAWSAGSWSSRRSPVTALVAGTGAEAILDDPRRRAQRRAAATPRRGRSRGRRRACPASPRSPATCRPCGHRSWPTALRAAGPTGRSFVPDATGTGTVLLAAPPGAPLIRASALGSAAAHAASGAVAPRRRTGRACGAMWTPPPTSPRPSSWASVAPATVTGRAVASPADGAATAEPVSDGTVMTAG